MVVVTQSIGTGSGRSSDAEPDQLRIWVREVAHLQHQVIGRVDAQDGRSAGRRWSIGFRAVDQRTDQVPGRLGGMRRGVGGICSRHSGSSRVIQAA
jgi:hypothetical protein